MTSIDFHIISLFPEMFDALSVGITGRAFEKKLAKCTLWNPRDFTTDTYKTVDDTPFGGGPGMVMKPEPLSLAIQAARKAAPTDCEVHYLSPAGRPLTQTHINQLAKAPGLILLCGRYEGVDQRVIDHHVDHCWSIGDYVLSGGELPAMVLIDSLLRQRPQVLGNPDSLINESFSQGLLDYPHYTRPSEFEGETVPEVLRGGNHAKIERWRLKQALGQTWEIRKEMIKALQNAKKLDRMQRLLLAEYIREHRQSRKKAT